MKTISPIAALILVTFASPTQAQRPANSLEVSPFFGYLFGGKVYDFGFSSPLPVPNTRYDLADHLTYGLRIGYILGSRVEPEIQWSHTETALRSSFTASTVCPSVGCLKLDYFLGGIVYNLSRGRTRPYVSLSAGVARFSPTFSRELTNNEPGSDIRFTGGLGVGAKVFITPSLGLRLDAHGYGSRIANINFGVVCTTFSSSGLGQPIIPTTAPCPTKQWLLNGELSGGLLLAF